MAVSSSLEGVRPAAVSRKKMVSEGFQVSAPQQAVDSWWLVFVTLLCKLCLHEQLCRAWGRGEMGPHTLDRPPLLPLPRPSPAWAWIKGTWPGISPAACLLAPNSPRTQCQLPMCPVWQPLCKWGTRAGAGSALSDCTWHISNP